MRISNDINASVKHNLETNHNFGFKDSKMFVLKRDDDHHC